MMLDSEIWSKVMERFPKIDKERTCNTEREFRQAARLSYYKTLYERKAKESILAQQCPDDAENRSEV